MPTLTQRADFAEDPDIQPAIVAAMTLTAVKVANEDDTTPNHTNRAALANSVLNAPSRHLSSFAWALSTNGTVVDKWTARDVEGAVADFEFVMGEVWDAIAGKPRPGRPTAPPVTEV